MPHLEFQHTLQHPAGKVLRALSRIDQHQHFIPGCKTSIVETCEQAGDQSWRGTARYLFEIKRYGISEEAAINYFVDETNHVLRFSTSDGDEPDVRAKIAYSIVAEAPDRSTVNVQLEYSKLGKKFFWFAVKPLARRFFYKFMGLVDKRISEAGSSLDEPIRAGTSLGNSEKAVRGFRQFDESSYAARMEVLKLLPEKSVGAEIGTYMGAFAQLILDEVSPKKLYLIDPWVGLDDASVAGSWYETVDQSYMDEIHEMVSQRFSAAVAGGTVEIIRDYSTNAMRGMQDGSLDWTYVDGDHSYEAVRGDLQLSLLKVRSGGIIAGDDFVAGDHWWKDNVVRAVTEFVDANPVDLILETSGQYAIRKR